MVVAGRSVYPGRSYKSSRKGKGIASMRLNSPRELATPTSSEDEEIPQRGRINVLGGKPRPIPIDE